MMVDDISVLEEPFQTASATFWEALELEQDAQYQAKLATLLTTQVEQWQSISEQVAELQLLGLFDVIEIFSAALAEWIEQEQSINDAIWEALDHWYSYFGLLFEQATFLEAAEQLIYCLQSPCWQSELDDEISAELLMALVSTDTTEAQEFTPVYRMDSDTDLVVEENTTVVQAQLINLISTEFSFFVGEFSQRIDQAVMTGASDYLAVVAQKLRKFDNLQEACKAADLVGLHLIFQHMHAGLKQRPAEGFDYQLEARLLKSSLLLIQDYLDHVSDSQKAQALVSILQLQGGRITASSRQAEQWLALLTVAIDEPHAPASKRIIAQPADVSLSVEAEISSDILDTTLHELALLSTGFYQVVAKLIAPEASVELLLEAQRIAHTLKGTAGIIGITGIMELTHHLEAILEKLSEHNRLPPPALADLFQESADCLESMCEALRGEGEAPANALPLLQSVLDWVYQIDKEGIPESEASVLNYKTPVALELESHSPVAVDAEPQKTLAKTTVASVFIDDLMQSLSEGIIVNEQLKTTTNTLIADNKHVRLMAWKLHEFTAELDHLVHIKNGATQQKTAKFDALELDQYNELHSCVNRVAEIAADIREMNVGMNQQLNNLKTMLLAQDVMQKENLDIVRQIRLLPAEKIASRCQRIVRQTAKITEKEVALRIIGQQTLIDSETLNKLMDPLMHLLRNAVDHGIESPEVRRAADKPAQGQITLTFTKQGNFISVICSDDGQGLNREKILQTAIDKGLISVQDSAKMTANDLSRIILIPGFSTRQTSTQVSGRGIGMDAIHSQVLEMNGFMEIHSTEQLGMQINITLPLLLAATQAVLVRVGTTIYAVAEQGVQQMLASSDTHIVKQDGQFYYHYADQNYAIEHLSVLLGLGASAEIELESIRKPAILVADRTGTQNVVFVDAIIGAQDLIIKSFGDYVANIPGVLGAAILGNGDLAAVLDIYELLSIKHEYHFDSSDSVPIEPVRALPKVLVIDDSLSARKATARFMQDNGFDVETAIDGLDGLEKIEEQMPDIMLVDMEMPRMDGIELTAHIRHRDDLAALPIIMISSRTTAKHRERAQKAGVDKYLTKPFSEDELINAVEDILAFIY